jgi:hypothetical protein
MGSLHLDGVNDYCARTSSVPATTIPLTVGVWFRCDVTTPNFPVFFALINAGAGFDGYTLDYAAHSFNKQSRALTNRGVGNSVAAQTFTIEGDLEEWRSAVGIWESTASRAAFLDAGADKGVNTDSLTPSLTPDTLYAGGFTAPEVGGFLGGHLGYMLIWDVVLSDAEVGIFHAGFIPQEANLLAFHDFTVDPATTGGAVLDTVGGFDLTIHGAAYDSGQTPPVAYELGLVSEAPANTGAPVASGTPTQFSPLTCSTGTWTGDPTPVYAYQWQRDTGSGFANIPGASSSTYELDLADIDSMIRCHVTATNVGGNATADSNELGPVVGPPDPDMFMKWGGERVAAKRRIKWDGELVPPL